MRILTVRQPWAWAIIHGGKDVENRVRNLAGDYRGPVAIHVAKRADDDFYENPAHAFLPQKPSTGIWPWPTYTAPYWSELGNIIGVVDLVDVHHADWCWDEGDKPQCSIWAESEGYHLKLANPRPLAVSIPFTGALGLRTLDHITTERVRLELRLADTQ
jgi:hypothetical protein